MSDELQIRKEKALEFLKKYKQYSIYLVLTFIIWLGAFIRTRNLKLLQGKYLLALDPYVFLRYASYIVEHGKIMAVDMMRYFPSGFDPRKEGVLLAYILAYFYKFVNIFIPSLKFIQFDIIYPVIFFCVSIIIFYLLVERLFNYKVAILSSAFLAVIPTFLYRTMAGFSEKEPIGIFLMFLAFYFYVVAFKSKKLKFNILLGVLAGISTGLMGLIWGGFQFVLLIIPFFVLIKFFLNKMKRKNFYIYTSWFVSYLILICCFKQISFLNMLISFTTGAPLIIFLTLLLNFILKETNPFNIKDKLKNKIPLTIFSLIIFIILIFIISSILFGPSFIFSRLEEIKDKLIHPLGIDRFILTVAEAHQPYFTHWKSNFYWFFWIFFLGSILLFYNLVKSLKKYKYPLTGIFIIFLSAFIFSRYSPTSILNGENFVSTFLYIGSLVIFILFMLVLYLYTYYKNKEIYNKLTNLNESFIFTIIWFLLMVVAARGALRLFIVFSPITVILASYLIIKIFDYSFTTKDRLKQILYWAFIISVIMAPVQGSFVNFTKKAYNQATYTGPSFNSQWQQAMDWVKENTPKDAVFAHWWDYGYWVQTMGERATISDGGNALPWINHYVGRHALLAHSPKEALEYLKTHKVNYLLIISDEIGKYPAYASIGSDKNYDKFTQISSFVADPREVQETRTETIYLFKGGFVLDEDFTFKGKLYLKGSSGLVGFIVPVKQLNNTFNIGQPTAVLIHNGQRIDVPLECVYSGGVEYNYKQKGLEGCLMLTPTMKSTGQVSPFERAYYLSSKVRKTLFAQMFLLDKEWEGFKKVYDDTSIGYSLVHYDNYGRTLGPLKIWKITYPSGTKTNPNYLNMSYMPDDLR